MLGVLAEDLTKPAYLCVRASPLDGCGLFTTRSFQAGEAVAVIAGELVSKGEAIRRECEQGNYYIFYLKEDLFIDAVGGIGRWLNHSCTPSAHLATRDERTLWLLALRDIAANEEITVDYDDGQIYDFCRQRSPTCRGEQCPRLAER